MQLDKEHGITCIYMYFESTMLAISFIMNTSIINNCLYVFVNNYVSAKGGSYKQIFSVCFLIQENYCYIFWILNIVNEYVNTKI